MILSAAAVLRLHADYARMGDVDPRINASCIGDALDYARDLVETVRRERERKSLHDPEPGAEVADNATAVLVALASYAEAFDTPGDAMRTIEAAVQAQVAHEGNHLSITLLPRGGLPKIIKGVIEDVARMRTVRLSDIAETIAASVQSHDAKPRDNSRRRVRASRRR